MKSRTYSLISLIIMLLFLINSAHADVVVYDLPDVQPLRAILNTSGDKLLIACAGPDYNLLYFDLINEQYSTINTDSSSDVIKARPSVIIPIHTLNCFAVANTWLGSVSFIDMDTGNLAATIDVGIQPLEMAYCNLTTGEELLAIANHDDNTISYIDLGGYILLDTISIPGINPSTILWHDGLDKAYINCPESGNIIIHNIFFDQGNFQYVETDISAGPWPNAVTLNTTGNELIVGSSETGILNFIDTNTDLFLDKSYNVGQYISAITPVSIPNSVLVCHYNDDSLPESSRLTLINTDTGYTETLLIPDCQIFTPAYHPGTNLAGFESYITDEVILVYIDPFISAMSIFSREEVAGLPSSISVHPSSGAFYIPSILFGDLSVITAE